MVSDELLIGAAFTVHPRAPENMPAIRTLNTLAAPPRVAGIGEARERGGKKAAGGVVKKRHAGFFLAWKTLVFGRAILSFEK